MTIKMPVAIQCFEYYRHMKIIDIAYLSTYYNEEENLRFD